MAQVVLKDLNKKYDEVHAVKDVNLHIRDKEFVVLVGPSGCGKSTTLRMVAGHEEITSGEITIGDRIVNDLPPKDRDIAMVFQNYALYPHMSVYDNMAFGLKMRKFPKAEIQKRVQDAAELLGIQELLKRKQRQLSGGQRQRVAVGRAIVRHPQVFLFDEPLSNLDAKLRVQTTVADGAGALWVECAGLRLRVPAERSSQLAGKRRQSVVLGIRPEDLHPATGADPVDLTCEAVVDVVEPLGSDILLDVKVGNYVIVLRVDPSVRLRQHDKIRLAFTPERIHFFDAKTEESLQ